MSAKSKAAVAAVRKEILAESPPEADAEPLSADQRREIVWALESVIGGLYTHLPQKRATYGDDPLQRLRLLEQRLESIDDREFHQSMAEIVTDLRDAHTRYIGPENLREWVAILPIMVERYSDADGEHFVVSKVFDDERQAKEFAKVGFAGGVEVTHWSGVPIHRAIELHAERETGGHPDARRARALRSLTFRSLRYALFPHEEWVVVSFRKSDGSTGEVRLPWRYARVQELPKAMEVEGPAAYAYAGDPAAEMHRRMKKMLFAPEVWYEAATAKKRSMVRAAVRPKARVTKSPSSDWFGGEFADVVSARTVTTPAGQFGQLRLWSFDVRDDVGFVDDVIALVDRLPREGLIIDLRSNPGGLIWAAERLLQLFTPEPVAPNTFSMLASDLTRTMADALQNQRSLGAWRGSLRSAVVTGELYSRGVPLTPLERCNDIGQRYPGPVVAIVDANTYSAGDLFAAGFVDNRIGTLISVDKATGAGGANVWSAGLVQSALAGTSFASQGLPHGITYTIAVRRAHRAGASMGIGIEDVGIPGHIRRELTKQDLTGDNSDLLAFCGRLLASEPFSDMQPLVNNGTLEVRVTNLDRVDVFVDGRPAASLDTGVRVGTTTVSHPVGESWSEIEVSGYTGAIRRQRRILRPLGV